MKSLLLLALGLARTVVLGARIEAERIVVSVRPYKREQRRCLFLIAFIFRKSRDKSFGFHDDCFAS
ncbi:hypothetical protein ACTNEU_03580 [Ellagibacter isourolithinifaciens]|uniref:hypothetical protein n=1 Tax=Ellagibacter isourolithinifaciens TaxID=2137581 RepID=UPI003F8BB911